MSEHRFMCESDQYKYSLAEVALIWDDSMEYIDDLVREYESRLFSHTTDKMTPDARLAAYAVKKLCTLRNAFEVASDSRAAWRKRALELGHKGPIHVEHGERFQ